MASLGPRLKNLTTILQVLYFGSKEEILINISLHSDHLGVGAGSASHSAVLPHPSRVEPLDLSEQSAPQLSFHRAFPDI